ncbi:hypothetical protein DFQ05_2602 [Winogradskyella wandonensis]|uniref:Uncharacterized protein n=2 Tax=Winogradskyella TaxID=286104 RepID=A0A4R1KKJ7_9FLAO|nr:hypothetical protein DFQ05_2602 [Winogradskyella wandonensis]SHH68872.1 hypothetical protein SAMN05444148_2680 [Winogradskyella jejuensis]
MDKQTHEKQPWLKSYTLVLVANLIYIILFYFITQAF